MAELPDVAGLAPPLQTAKVKSQAVKDLVTGFTSGNESNSADTNILARIRKCLERGNHANTPEAEAQAALRIASRLMAQCNVTQAEVLASAASEEDRMQLAGQSVVAITRTKARRSRGQDSDKVISQTWVHDVASAMTILFDCKVYSTAKDYPASIEWTFYGIATNTAAAAVAFERVHNLVGHWSMKQRGLKNSYCLGVAAGLIKIAKEEKNREEQEVKKREAKEWHTRIKKEAEERENELARLERSADHQATVVEDVEIKIEEEDVPSNTPQYNIPGAFHTNSCMGTDEDINEASPQSSGSQSISEDSFESAAEDPYASDDDNSSSYSGNEVTFKEGDESELDVLGDLDDQIELQRQSIAHNEKQLATKETEGVTDKREKVNLELESSSLTINWSTSKALTVFRQHATEVAESWLKQQSVKLSKGRKRDSTIRDWDAYRHGQKDSTHIDVKRKRIKREEQHQG